MGMLAAGRAPLRGAVAGAVLAVSLLGLGARGADARREASPPPRPHAVLAFLPAGASPRGPLLVRLGWRRELALGLVSPTLGGYSPAQAVLDLSQGARLARRAYGRELSRLRVVRDGGGARVEGWQAASVRARAAPGRVVPGLLADAVVASGGRVAYVGTTSFEASDAPEPVEAVEGIAAADSRGRVARVSLGTSDTFDRRAAVLRARSELLVARLPAGDGGLGALDRLLAERGPGDMVVVLRTPPPGGLRLLPVGIAAPGLHGTLASGATRREGLVTAPDVSATVLAHVTGSVPAAADGRVLTGRPGADARELLARSARLDVVVDRRWPVVRGFAAAWIAVLALAAVARHPGFLRAVLRWGLLGALWAPGLALATAALSPPEPVEVVVLALGSLALGVVTDRLLPWPRGPLLPAGVVMAACAVDLAAGSPLIAASIVGPNPKGGGRFYGVGNELEIMLAASVLLGAGAALHRARPALAARGFALVSLVAGAVVGLGLLGADVGGVVTLGAGAAAAVTVCLRGRLGRLSLGALLGVPVVAVVALAGVDWLTAGGAHLSGTLSRLGSPLDLLTVMERRARISLGGLLKGPTPLFVGGTLLILAGGVAARRRLLAPLLGVGGPAWRAGLAGTFAATLAGTLANDSGPIVLMIGTAALVLAVAYVLGAPRPARCGGPASPATTPTSTTRAGPAAV